MLIGDPHLLLLKKSRSAILSALLVPAGLGGVAQQAPLAPAQKPPPPSQPVSGLHAADVLMGFSSDMESLAHTIEPAVVKIYSTGLAPVENGDTNRTAFLAQQRSVGSGVIMDAQGGYILTNAHVVQHARTLSVLVPDMSGVVDAGDGNRAEPPATAVPARIVGIDTVTDLAVIKVEKPGMRALEIWRLRPHPSGRAGAGFWKSTGLAG